VTLKEYAERQCRDLQERGILPKQGSKTDEKSTSDTRSTDLLGLSAAVDDSHVLAG
jgi:hypothetical protein